MGSEGVMMATEIALPTDAACGQAAVASRDSAAEMALVRACRGGDQAAFTRLVELHEGLVFNLAVRLLGDGEEARDVSQEVFLQLHRSLPRFEGRSSLRTWIYRIVVNHCRNRQRWWRRRRRDRACALDDISRADEAQLAVRSAGSEDPFAQVARHEREERVRSALDRLSFDHRTILMLKEVEGLSCEEVGEALQLAVGTVKSRLSRAREALRVSLGPWPPEGGRP
jgi:RNA polymerase sigma-70 factor (ECF subfamily)